METFTFTQTFTQSFGFIMADTMISGDVIALIFFIIYKSKTLRDSIEDSPVLFAFISMATVGFVGWLLAWALFEIILTITYEVDNEAKKKKRAKKKAKKAEKQEDIEETELKEKKYI